MADLAADSDETDEREPIQFINNPNAGMLPDAFFLFIIVVLFILIARYASNVNNCDKVTWEHSISTGFDVEICLIDSVHKAKFSA